jgi:UDP-2,4-diacetamido-2,4,6-trideoxy-beta-L-altropyranose hydrolase
MKTVFRADAFSSLGTGHVMRCLAFAQGIKDSGSEVLFATYCEGQGLLDRLRKEGFDMHLLTAPGSLKESLEIMDREKPDWVVLDGYHFDTEFQKAVKDAGLRLLYIDDYAHLERYYADIILNQNYGAEKFHYNADPYTKILAGPEYVLMRREFLEYAAVQREIPDIARKVLITMGGADPDNHTSKILHAINLVDIPLDVKVVIGASSIHYDSVRLLAEKSKHTVEVLRAVENMAPLMVWADIALSAGGTTVWELAFMGVPSVLCIVAANQEYAVTSLGEAGIFFSVGWVKDRTDDEIAGSVSKLMSDRLMREDIASKGKKLVDGKGGKRISMAIKEQITFYVLLTDLLRGDTSFGKVKLENYLNLTEEEHKLILEKRNSDDIRRWMFNDHIISAAEHKHFLQKLKQNGNNFYWLVKEDSMPIGVVSAQKVDFALRESFLGIYSIRKGAGDVLMHHFLRFWFSLLGMRSLISEVLADNNNALEFYRKHGFRETGFTRYVIKNGGERKVVTLSLDAERYSTVKKSDAA